MYQVYYYDSWSDSYEKSSSFRSLEAAQDYVSREFLCSTDSDITAVYISWFDEFRVEHEIQYVLSGNSWKKVS